MIFSGEEPSEPEARGMLEKVLNALTDLADPWDPETGHSGSWDASAENA
jgi:hypothetical protein